jgi:hypothetical protein
MEGTDTDADIGIDARTHVPDLGHVLGHGHDHRNSQRRRYIDTGTDTQAYRHTGTGTDTQA